MEQPPRICEPIAGYACVAAAFLPVDNQRDDVYPRINDSHDTRCRKTGRIAPAGSVLQYDFYDFTVSTVDIDKLPAPVFCLDPAQLRKQRR